MTRAVAVSLLLALTPLAARAQTVAILPPKIDPQVAPAEAKATLARIAAHLRQQGFTTLDSTAVQQKLSAKLRTCAEPDCARRTLEPLAADIALLVSLFPSLDGAGPSASLELVDKAGVSYSGAEASHPDTNPVIAVLDDAIARQRRGPGPWLTVQGEPRGADVLVDGKPVGVLPRCTGRVEPGTAHVVVREAGYKQLNALIDIGSNLDDNKVVDVKLEPEALPSLATPLAMRGTDEKAQSLGDRAALDANADDGTHGERRATAPDYVLGGSLALGGLLLASIDPIQTAAKSGQCADPDCRTLYSFSTRSAIEVASGAALVLLGVAVTFWWKPFSVRASTGERTSIALQAHF
jgi:hypothetical protein